MKFYKKTLKKNTIAPALANDEIIIENDSFIHWKKTKVKTKVEMLPKLLMSERQPGDIIIHRIAYGSEIDTIVNILKTNENFTSNAVFMHIHEESERDKEDAKIFLVHSFLIIFSSMIITLS